jgi:hypothetical protein
VADVLIAAPTLKLVEGLKTALRRKYVVSDMGPISMMLGIEILRTPEGIKLTQSGYLEEVLSENNMLDCSPTKTPTTPNLNLPRDGEILNQEGYQHIVGQLMYLARCSGPDIAFATMYLARLSHSPGGEHWKRVERLLRYLNGTRAKGVFYEREESDRLCAFSDADWAGDATDRKSTTGFVVFLCTHLVDRGSIKQESVALSTRGAEYIALSKAVQELLWLHMSRMDLNPPSLSVPAQIFCDNEAAISFARNESSSERSKHVDLRYMFVRKEVEEGTISVSHNSSKTMLADALTKALPLDTHRTLVSHLMT